MSCDAEIRDEGNNLHLLLNFALLLGANYLISERQKCTHRIKYLCGFAET